MMLTNVNTAVQESDPDDTPNLRPPSAAVRRYLDAAQRVLETEGSGGLTIRAVGEAAGVSGPALYRHFRDKSGLIHAVYASLEDRWLTELAADSDPPDPAAKLRALLERYIRFGVESGVLYRTLFTPPPEFVEAGVLSDSVRLRERTMALIREPVRRCIEAGVLRRDDTDEAAMTLWATLHGLLMLYRPEPSWSDESRRAFLHQFGGTVARILRGLS